MLILDEKLGKNLMAMTLQQISFGPEGSNEKRRIPNVLGFSLTS
jgi:hypothetical protein